MLRRGEGEVVPLPGASLVIKDRMPGAMDACAITEFTAEPGFSGPGPHVHEDSIEYILVLEGEFEWSIDGEAVRVSAGDYIRIPKGAVHNFGNVGTTQGRWFGVGCTSEIDLY